MGATIMMLVGAAVYYQTRLQSMGAQSLTEAEFTNIVDVWKVALYPKWILEELGIIMNFLTPIYEDNQGAIRIANSQQPTQRRQDVEMKNCVIWDWITRNMQQTHYSQFL